MGWSGSNRFGKAPRGSPYARQSAETQRVSIQNERLQEWLRLRARDGEGPVTKREAHLLEQQGVPVNVYGAPPDGARMYMVPLSCSQLIRQWHDAQNHAGAGGKVKEFRELTLARVCWLAAEEWKAQGGVSVKNEVAF